MKLFITLGAALVFLFGCAGTVGAGAGNLTGYKHERSHQYGIHVRTGGAFKSYPPSVIHRHKYRGFHINKHRYRVHQKPHIRHYKIYRDHSGIKFHLHSGQGSVKFYFNSGHSKESRRYLRHHNHRNAYRYGLRHYNRSFNHYRHGDGIRVKR